MLRIDRCIGIVLLLMGVTGCIEKPEPEPRDELDRRLKTELPKATYEVRQQVRTLLQKVRDDLVFVEGGSFQMGDIGQTDADGDWLQWTFEENDNHIHSVTLDSYALSAYETTWEQLALYLDAIGVEPRKEGWHVASSQDIDDQYYYLKPAMAPSWTIASNYCQWLGRLAGLPVDLPTEAQWEYAARSRGQNVRFATDDGTLHSQSIDGRKQNYSDGYPGGSWLLNQMPVGSYPPNPLGLYDMTGNVKEWTRDWYQPDYYKRSPELNPQGPDNGYKRSKVIRDWGGGPGYADIPSRGGFSYDNGSDGIGFRCAANIKEPLQG